MQSHITYIQNYIKNVLSTLFSYLALIIKLGLRNPCSKVIFYSPQAGEYFDVDSNMIDIIRSHIFPSFFNLFSK
jgi:hypothetical protein